MAFQEFIMLRAPGMDREDIWTGGRGGAEMPAVGLSLEKATLSLDELMDVRRERDVLEMAPVMPVTLVAPISMDGPRSAEAGEAAWGVEAVGALESSFSGVGVTVAILDTGIDVGHEAFRSKTIVQMDFTGEGDGDENGHGTHCAGTVFGGGVGGLRIGVAPGVEKALIGKVLDAAGRGSTAQILDGILWAVHEGSQIVSLSIGLDFPGLVRRLIDDGLEVEPATSRALAAYRENVRLFDTLAGFVRAHSAMFARSILIAAAGNECRRPQYEIAVAPPAAADGFISVGAVSQTGGRTPSLEVASFSNTLPDVVGPGVAVQSAKAGGGLAFLSESSMATPHVAEVAAPRSSHARTTRV